MTISWLHRAQVLTLPAAAALLWCFCSGSGGLAAGGGTDIDNARVSGMLVDTAGAVAGATAHLMKIGVDPAACTTAACQGTVVSTDSRGQYLFPAVATGMYRLYALDAGRGFSALRCTVLVDKESVELGRDTLRPTGSVIVKAVDSLFEEGDYLYLPGTPLYWYFDSTEDDSGRFEIDSLPAGSVIPYLVIHRDGAPERYTVGRDIEVAENDSVEVDCTTGDTVEAEVVP